MVIPKCSFIAFAFTRHLRLAMVIVAQDHPEAKECYIIA